LTITNVGNGDIMIDFSGANTASDFTVLRKFVATSTVETIGSFTQRPIIISGLDTTETWFLQLFAANDFGASPITELSGVKPSHSSQKTLIVNGFDRTNGTTNSKDYIRQHGSALWEQGQAFDGSTNEAVIAGMVDLNDYRVVDWILGEEGAVNSTFTAEEQILIREYLENGGHLIISGSEIGYDLVAQGSSADQLFYQNYLKAEYISDAAGGHQGTYGAFGTSGSIFDGITAIDFDNGTHGTYDVDYPDGIKPTGGAEICAKFSNVDYATKGGAGICYNGPFNDSPAYGTLVYLSIGFETIYPTAKRDELMTRIINYFDQADAGNIDTMPNIPAEIGITAIYPNPFNSRVNIAVKLPQTNTVASSLIIVDLLGRIVTELNISAITGSGTIIWDGRTNDGKIAPTGMYLAILKSQNKQFIRKFTLMK
ncbi:MAG: T9SS type A sorting domain-containing protein, partial [Candidatus Marinimicrobia bacterium]|nr:T9SS type A sorting domain-containing protein [Candidatus Neomarinimicrobiota bacterium]